MKFSRYLRESTSIKKGDFIYFEVESRPGQYVNCGCVVGERLGFGGYIALSSTCVNDPKNISLRSIDMPLCVFVTEDGKVLDGENGRTYAEVKKFDGTLKEFKEFLKLKLD